eukprot:scaffold142072_cov28-Tisochrysis_lutea.AAC.1
MHPPRAVLCICRRLRGGIDVIVCGVESGRTARARRGHSGGAASLLMSGNSLAISTDNDRSPGGRMMSEWLYGKLLVVGDAELGIIGKTDKYWARFAHGLHQGGDWYRLCSWTLQEFERLACCFPLSIAAQALPPGAHRYDAIWVCRLGDNLRDSMRGTVLEDRQECCMRAHV